MHAWAAIVMFVGASLGFVGLISLGVAALATTLPSVSGRRTYHWWT